MRRKPGTLVPLEIAICQCAAEMARLGVSEFHGYELAKTLAETTNHATLAAYGTLYRALGRLRDLGLLRSRWEDPRIAAKASRPPRRLYTLTATGEAAAREAHNAALAKAGKRKAWVPV